MKNKLIFFLFAVMLVSNLYIFLHREEYVFKKQFSYTDLYPRVSATAIKNTEKINDSTLRFNLLNPLPEPVKWYIVPHQKTDSQTAVNPILLLQKGICSYNVFSPVYKDSIGLRIEYISAKENGGTSFIGKYKSTEGKITPQEIMGEDYTFDKINAVEQQQVADILRDSIKINIALPSAKKVQQIFIYLHKKLFAQRGQPDAATLQLNTFEQYKAALAGKKIWCGIYANIFTMFVVKAGIPCRFLEMKNDFGNIAGSTHEVSEYFCAEKTQWVAVDLMFNIIQTSNANGSILNTVEVKNTAAYDSSVKVLQVQGDSLMSNAFSKMELPFFDFYGRDKDLYLYNTTAAKFNAGIFKKIKNHITKTYWYGCYSDIKIVENLKFYIKQAAIILLIIFSLAMLIMLTKKLKKS